MAQAPTAQYASPILQKFPPLFRNRNFILLWLGYVISAVGDRIHFLVMLQLLTNVIGALRHDPTFTAGTQQSSQLTILMLLPFVLLGPVTGIIADRLPRRLIMIVADLVRVVIVITARTVFIEFQGPLGLTNVLILLFISEFILAAFAALFSPARLALLPTLVHPDQLLRANSMTNAAGTIASLLGFVIGGKLVAWHLVYAMYIDAGTFALSAMLLIMMRLPRRATQTTASGAAGVAGTDAQGAGIVDYSLQVAPKPGLFTDFKEGIGYIWAHKRVLQIIALMLLFWCCGTIILNGLTGIVTDYFALPLEWFSYFMGLSGVGMIIGAGLVSLARHGIPKEVGIAWSMVAVGVFLFFFSRVTREHWRIGLVFLTIAAVPSAVLLISLETLLQRVVPNFVRGRVMGVKDVITTFGLISVAIPLAINPRIDEIIRLVLSVLSIVVVGVGFGLVIYYYKRQAIPWPAAICRRAAAAYLSIWQRFSRQGACTIPGQGGVIVVANHSNAMDPVILQVSSPRRVLHFMMAKEYYEKWPFVYLYKAFGCIPVNRTGNDVSSIRTALRTLKDGKVLGMFPEGRISEDGQMHEAKSGVAMLALMSGAPVVPAFIWGVNVYRGMVADFVGRGRVRIAYGRPLRFTQFGGKEREEASRDEVTRQIMEAIRKLRDRHAPQAGAEHEGEPSANSDALTKAS